MKKERTINNTEQIKRMKKYALSDVYSNGSDLYKLGVWGEVVYDEVFINNMSFGNDNSFFL